MPSLFLPFSANGKATELAAIEVKRRLGIGATAVVDPFAVLPTIPARLIDASMLTSAMLSTCAAEWSGIGFGRIGAAGEELIALNPTHTETRQRVTLMEEIVHIVLDHPKTTLSVRTGGALAANLISVTSAQPPSRTRARSTSTSSARTYSATVEDDAFNIGAACVLPWPELYNAVHRRHEDTVTIAQRFLVSAELVAYRINRAGLARVYKKHHP